MQYPTARRVPAIEFDWIIPVCWVLNSMIGDHVLPDELLGLLRYSEESAVDTRVAGVKIAKSRSRGITTGSARGPSYAVILAKLRNYAQSLLSTRI